MVKSANGKIFYGTLRECVDELFTMIDFDNREFPAFDFASNVDEDYETVESAWNDAESWHGVKPITHLFGCDTISIVIAHYSGGGIQSMEFYDDSSEDELKEMLIRKICESVDDIGYGWLNEDEYTVFEIL